VHVVEPPGGRLLLSNGVGQLLAVTNEPAVVVERLVVVAEAEARGRLRSAGRPARLLVTYAKRFRSVQFGVPTWTGLLTNCPGARREYESTGLFRSGVDRNPYGWDRPPYVSSRNREYRAVGENRVSRWAGGRNAKTPPAIADGVLR